MLKHLPLLSLPLAGAALIVALSGPDQPEAPTPQPDSELRDEVVGLKARIKTLEGDADLLRARLRVLEGRTGAPDTSGSTANAVAPGGGGKPDEALRELIQSPQIKEVVRSVQDELREEQRRERLERKRQEEQQAQAETRERWRKFVTDQRLDYRQEQTLMSRLELERSRREALMADVRDGKRPMREVRAEMRTLHEETDKELRSVLSEAQLQAYMSERRGSIPRGPRGERSERGQRGGGQNRPEGQRGRQR